MNEESSVYAGFCPPGWVRFNMSRAALWYETDGMARANINGSDNS